MRIRLIASHPDDASTTTEYDLFNRKLNNIKYTNLRVIHKSGARHLVYRDGEKFRNYRTQMLINISEIYHSKHKGRTYVNSSVTCALLHTHTLKQDLRRFSETKRQVKRGPLRGDTKRNENFFRFDSMIIKINTVKPRFNEFGW